MTRGNWWQVVAVMTLVSTSGLMVRPVSAQVGATVGGTLFVERNNDGLYDPAWVETPVANAVVGLYLDSDATPGFSAGDSQVMTTTTTVTGAYAFTLTSVSAFDYIVRVQPGNWSASGAILSGVSNNPVHVSSTYQAYPGTAATPDPDSSTGVSDDNGLDILNPALNGVYSLPFALSDGIVRSDIAFGFFRLDLVRSIPECRIAAPGQPTVFTFSPSNGLGYATPVTITVAGGTPLGLVPTALPFPSQLPGKFVYAPGRLNYVEPQALHVSSTGLPNVRTTAFNPYLNGGTLQASQLNGNNQIPCSHSVFPDIDWRDNDGSAMVSLTRLDLSAYALSLTGSAGGSGGCTYNAARQRVCSHSNINIANGAGGLYSNAGNTLSAMIPFSQTYTVTQSGLPPGCEVVRGADGAPQTDYTLSLLGFGGGNEADDYGLHGFYVGSDPLRRGTTDNGRHPLPGIGRFDDFRTQVLHEVVNRCYLMRLGNRIWHDLNDNGLYEPATEAGIAAVQVELLDAGGAVITSTVTDAQGRYAFTGLVGGRYQVRVAAANFAPGGGLAGWQSSTPTVPPDSGFDDDDSGLNTTTAISDGVVSDPVTLTWLSEPVVEVLDETSDYRDSDSNLTVDFGFAPTPQVTVDKALVSADTDLIAPNFITFTLDAGNTGQSALDVIPLTDSYDPALLAFFSASIRPDDNFNDGTLTWSDLTQPGQRGIGRNLGPGETLSLTVVFRIAADVSTSSNTATLSGVTDINGLVAAEASDTVIFSDLPTSVELVEFRVGAVDGRLITLDWTTATEVDTAQFVLYRGRARDGRDARSVAVRPAIGAQGGAAYTVTDVAPDPGPWWYWLADVDTRGNETRHGPVGAGGFPARSGPETIYLPFIRR